MTKTLETLVGVATQLATLPRERDQLIVDARREGYAWQDIADAAGLTPAAAQTAAKRANGGKLPMPTETKPRARAARMPRLPDVAN